MRLLEKKYIFLAEKGVATADFHANNVGVSKNRVVMVIIWHHGTNFWHHIF